MSQVVNNKCLGLYTFQNKTESRPKGSLSTADNIIIDKENTIEPRRGFKVYTSANFSTTINQLLQYKNRIITHYGTKLAFDNGSGTFSDFSGTYNQTTIGSNSFRIKFLEANGNLYFNTSAGIKKISATAASQFSTSSGYITDAGMYKALDIALETNGSSGFLPNNNYVAYRVVWGIKDSNNNLIIGSPSSRTIIQNVSGGSRNIRIAFPVPDGITTSHFFQIYRTKVSTTSEPGDETFLTFESNPTSTQISNKLVGYSGDPDAPIDITPDTLLGAALYTNEISGFGAQQANDPPPVALDLATFKNSTFYANTQTKQRKTINLLGITKFYSNVATIDASPGGISAANPTTVTTTAAHGLSTGNVVAIFGSTSTPSINGVHSVTVTGATTFTIPVNVTVAGGGGSVNLVNARIAISDGTTHVTYIASEAEDTVFTGETVKFKLFTTGTDSVNVDDTARSLVKMINRTTTNGIVYAYYNTNTDVAPGQITLEVRSLGSAAFYLLANNSSTGESFIPDLSPTNTTINSISVANPTVVTTSSAHGLSTGNQIMICNTNSTPNIDGLYTVTVTSSTTFTVPVNVTVSGNRGSWELKSVAEVSSDETSPNRIYYSRTQQPDAVPTLNYFDVGPKDKAILRILALRDSLFVLKEEGIYRISGSGAGFFVLTPFDNSVTLNAPDSAAILNNEIYCLTTQGVATISDTGVSIISRPIEEDLRKLFQHTNFRTATFGLTVDTDRAYYLWTVTLTADTAATQCYRYNTFTNSWTRWNITKRAGILNSADDKIYLAANDINAIEQERKAFTREDHADREYSITANIVSNKDIIISSTTNTAVGDVIVQTQYLTVAQYNRILRKLDNDMGVSDSNYLSTLQAVAGDEMRAKLLSLGTKLDADSGVTDTNYNAQVGGSTAFSDIQSYFNLIVNKLNADSGVDMTNYPTSSGTTSFEAKITAVDTSTNKITVDIALPFINGPLTVYKHIESSVVWNPEYFDNAGVLKQVTESTFMFDADNFSSGVMAFASDLSGSFDEIEVAGSGKGLFGQSDNFGEGIFGGSGYGSPIRTYVLLEKQRCRYISPKWKHKNAFENYKLIGYTFVFENTSSRAYR